MGEPTTTLWSIHHRWVPQPNAAELASIAWSADGELVAESVYADMAEQIIREHNAHDDLVSAVNALLDIVEAELADDLTSWKRAIAMGKKALRSAGYAVEHRAPGAFGISTADGVLLAAIAYGGALELR